MAVAASAAIDRIEQASDLRDRLKTLRQDAAEAICAPLCLPSPRSQIVPVILGEDGRAMAAAAVFGVRASFNDACSHRRLADEDVS